MTDAAVWATLVRTAQDKFGGLDIVINNAGTSYRNKPTTEVTEADFDKCFSVNVKSVFLSIPACVPALEQRGGGAIINVASIGAIRPRPGLVWYNASKGAVANVSISYLAGTRAVICGGFRSRRAVSSSCRTVCMTNQVLMSRRPRA